MFPFPGTDLASDHSDGRSESGEAVEDGDPDLELRDLTVEVARCQSLPQQFDAVHLCLDAAPAVIPAPSSPDGPSDAF